MREGEARPSFSSLITHHSSLLLRLRGLVVGAEPAGRELRHVVDDDEAHQQQQEDEADLLYALAHLHRELHAYEPERAFEEDHEDHAAVEHGDGQQVEDAEVQAQEAEHDEDAFPAALFGCALRRVRDAYRPREGVAHRAAAREDLRERLARQAQHLYVSPDRVARGRGEPEAARGRVFERLEAEALRAVFELARLRGYLARRAVRGREHDAYRLAGVRAYVLPDLLAARDALAADADDALAELHARLVGGRPLLHVADDDGHVAVVGQNP